MHSGAVIFKQRFRHKCDNFAVPFCDISHCIFVHHHRVSCSEQGVIFHIDFSLSTSCNLMVLRFYCQPKIIYQRPHHLTPKVLTSIHWRCGEVTLFVSRTIAFVNCFSVQHIGLTRIPNAFVGVDFMEPKVGAVIELN